MKIPNNLKQTILSYCKTAEPNEACGFVVLGYQTGEPQFLPCENVALDSENYFEILPEDFIRAEQQGEVVAVVHSHPNGEMHLSIADRQMQDNVQLDFWLVCNSDLQNFPVIRPLVGREFVHGQTDCYTIFRDFYYLAGADLPDFERTDEWWVKGGDLYLQNITRHGFKRLDPAENLQIGDVILMQVGADVPNHAGIYLGNQMVLHHSPKRLSKRDLYDGYWLKHTHSIWRFEQWSQLDFTVPLNHLAKSFSLM
ncbi:C40 family peptidase [Frederiksenia canicola]|uniref:Phage tail protein n=1 Tax=Frederiksenia canicola TaxID=123824 RepID=A0AAE6X7G8_9PAST|nr:C40 family peptidase [Frederiksenia canicola]QIM65276.1 phage tail protein [Frederiksenia canicola]